MRLAEGRGISAALLEDVDVLLVRSVTRVDASLAAAGKLHFVGTATAGIDHVDCAALAARNIHFASAPGSNAQSVVDYVCSAICHSGDTLERLLAGASVGIIGYGHVGRALYRRLQALGIKALAYDPWLESDVFPELVELHQVLACEVVSVHAELTRQQPWPSYHLLGDDELNQLHPTALLINASRGELVDPTALLHVLAARPELQVVLDVWENEPHIDEQLRARCKLATPHIAGYSFDAKLRASHMLYRALCESLQIKSLRSSDGDEHWYVDVPVDLQGAALLRWLLLETYDIRLDHAALLAAMPSGFDQLRRDYRKRRELSTLRISNGPALLPAARALCTALGCLD